MARFCVVVVLLAVSQFASTDLVNYNLEQTTNRATKSRTLYDYQTRIAAYKDLTRSVCLLEFLNRGDNVISQKITEREGVDLPKNTQIRDSKLSKRQIWTLAGQRVVEFCRGFPTYLIVESGDEENNVLAEDPYSIRRKRSTHFFRGRVRGQTQSQYLNFGPGGEPGKAEAESSYGVSKAVVSGSSGMGQAQSQSSPVGCEGCGGEDIGDQEQVLQFGQGVKPERHEEGDGLGGRGPGALLRPGEVGRRPGVDQYGRPVDGSGRPGIDQQGGGGVKPGGEAGGGKPGVDQFGRPVDAGRGPSVGGGRKPGFDEYGRPIDTGRGGKPGIDQYGRPIEGGSPGAGQYGPSVGGGSGPDQYGGGRKPGFDEYGRPIDTGRGKPGFDQFGRPIDGGTSGTGSGQYGPSTGAGTGGRPGSDQYGGVGKPGFDEYGRPIDTGRGERPGVDQYGRPIGTGQGVDQYGRPLEGGRPGTGGGVGKPGLDQYGRPLDGTGQGIGGRRPDSQQGIDKRPPSAGAGTIDQGGLSGYPGGKPATDSEHVSGPRGPGETVYPGQDGTRPGQQTYYIPGGSGQVPQEGQDRGTGPLHVIDLSGSQVPGRGVYNIPPGYRPGQGRFEGQLAGGYQTHTGQKGRFSGTFQGQYETDDQERRVGQLQQERPGYGRQPGSYGEQGGVQGRPGLGGAGYGVGYPGQGGPGDYGRGTGYRPGDQYETRPGYGQRGPGGQSIATPGGDDYGRGAGGRPGYGSQGVGVPGGDGYGTHGRGPQYGEQGVGGPGGDRYGTQGRGSPGYGEQGVGVPGGDGYGTYGRGPQYGEQGVGAPSGSGYGTQGRDRPGYEGQGVTSPGRDGYGSQGVGVPGGDGYGTQGRGPQYGGGEGYGAQGRGPGDRGQSIGVPGRGSYGQGGPGYGEQIGPGWTGEIGARYPGQGGIQGPGSRGQGQPIYPDQTSPQYTGQGGTSGYGGQRPGLTGQGGETGGQRGPGSYGPGQGGQTDGQRGSGSYGPGQGGQTDGQRGPGSYGPGQEVPGSLSYPETPGTSGKIQSIDARDDSDSQVQTSVQQINNQTQAKAQAQGKYAGGTAQSQVSGTYSGSGSFSASAGSDDGKRGAQTQVSGGKEGAQSSAQGRGGLGQSQAQVVLNSETGETISSGQTSGLNHGTQTQVQASSKGGMADSQANGPGSTSSQAQIGFTPHDPNEKDNQTVPYSGGASVSAQSGTYSGQTQSQIQGKFRYGIRYTGQAQASSGSFKNQTRRVLQPFKPYVFNNQNQSTAITYNQSKRSSPVDDLTESQTEQANPTERTKDEESQTQVPPAEDDLEYEDDYEDTSTEKPETRSLITQAGKNQKQHIVLDPLEDLDATVLQSSDGFPKDGAVLQPGELIPGSPGYRIPKGYRGRIRSFVQGKNAYTLGQNSQAQSVNLTPGSGKILYRSPLYAVSSNSQFRNGQVGYGSGYTYHPAQYYVKSGTSSALPSFVSVTKSESGSKDPITGKKTPNVSYTQASSCGIFTNSCIFNGSGRLCFTKPKTNPDGTLAGC